MTVSYRCHVLLIGCDKYPPNQNSLHGCVNDIDAIEDLLLKSPGVGIPPAQISVTRLAAPHSGALTSSRFVEQTRLPTRENIVAALKDLSSEAVLPSDRVLIYYSGHGAQTKRIGMSGWHECLVACDNMLLFDQELNALIAAIARRTSDLTFLLDCCHAAGATRAYLADPPHGAIRAATFTEPITQKPDPMITGAIFSVSSVESGLLQTAQPDYIAIVACQADEKAQEDLFDGVSIRGLLTHSLIRAVGTLSQQQRSIICWGHIWTRLIDEMDQAAIAIGRVAQHPWIIGQSARRLFGGSWLPRDAGFQVRHIAHGKLAIEAGQLLGFEVGTEVGIYGPDPALLPEPDSDADRRACIGTARVVEAARATCTAMAQKELPDPLPDGVRARMIASAQSSRLRVWIDQAEPDPRALVAQSELIAVVENVSQAEVWVDRTQEGWSLSNDLNRGFATLRLKVPDGVRAREEVVRGIHETLRYGLACYANYNAVLRLSKHCCDIMLDQALRVTVLDCSDEALLAQINPKNPTLAELSRGANQVYQVAARQPFCIRLTNTYFKNLAVTLLNCTAGGKVEHLGTIGINGEDIETIWFQGLHRSPFLAVPDNPTVDTIDRLIAIGTTRTGTNLSNLKTEFTIQQIFDLHDRGTVGSSETSELWTATICQVRMVRNV